MTMKIEWTKRWSGGAVALLFGGLLLADAPPVAWAGRPVSFTLQGLVLDIDQGDVKPAGVESVTQIEVAPGVFVPMLISASGRYIVEDRDVSGVIVRAPMIDAGTPFVLTYHANVPLLSQAGQVQAFLQAGGVELNTHFESQFFGPCNPLLATFAPLEVLCPDGVFQGIYVSGNATFTAGAIGRGAFQGWLIPILDPETGHIAAGFGAIQVDGQWNP
jgi:hypothetical protein